MTDSPPSAEDSGSAAPPSPSGAPPAEAQRAKAGSAEASAQGVSGRSPSWREEARRALPQSVASAAGSIGNWLASIGWGKFILLTFLMLALASLADDMFFSSHKGHRAPPEVPVEVKVIVDSNGLHISRPPHAPATAEQPKVQIDEKGVRVETDKDGNKSTVVIDNHGIRVEHTPSAPGKSSSQSAAPKAKGTEPDVSAGNEPDGSASGPVVTFPPGMISDPDKVSEAVAAVKDQIEEIVQEQVDRKVAGLQGVGKDESSEWPDVADWALMLAFALLIVKIAMGSKRRAESRAQAADAVAAEEGLKRQLAEARLKTMQAQVEPHFLFNTLASVDYLIETDPARASRMQKNLIQYLRAAVPQMRQASSTLGQEMALCRSYLEILKMRMDDRLQFTITMPAGLSTAAFPPMMLQTLVENSIKHGLEPKPEGGVLNLNADVVDGNLRVAVSDTGLGFGAATSSGGGVGLSNIRERLQALFGARSRLTIEANSPSGTIATIVVPYAVGVIEPAAQVWPQPA
jgi:histidine kinase/histidine kinase/DNA gyrase B/HSP90-like ATPase